MVAIPSSLGPGEIVGPVKLTAQAEISSYVVSELFVMEYAAYIPTGEGVIPVSIYRMGEDTREMSMSMELHSSEADE